jgi:NADP-dependent 3-hydroxy acid dehydrogenase YdfG/Tfp pilus assembly protein PilF
MKRLLLAYCHENQDLALEAAQYLPDVQCSYVTDQDGPLAELIAQAQEPTLLIITDNFFKNEQCMQGILGSLLMLLERNKVLPVLAPGIEVVNGIQIPVETHIDRVVYAIRYMNYWRDQYLNISELYNHATDAEKIILYPRLQRLHNIADHVGDFIAALRDSNYTTWAFLQEAQFVDIYTRLGIPLSTDGSRIATPVPPLPTAPALMETPATVETAPVETAPVETALVETPAEPSQPEPEAPTKHEPSPTATDLYFSRKEEEIESSIRDAWGWIQNGKKELGLEVFRLALEEYPDNQRLLTEYNLAARQNDTIPEAIEIENEAASYVSEGDSAFEQGDFDLAKYYWDRATEADPLFPGIWQKLGLMTSEYMPDKQQTAIVYLKRALELDPDNQAVRQRLIELNILEAPTAPVSEEEEVAQEPEVPSPFQEEALEELTVAPTPEEEPALVTTLETASVSELPIEEVEVENEEEEWEEEEEEIDSSLPVAQPTHHQQPRATVLITGATSGIGRATAIEFARHGYRLLLTGRRSERLFALKEELEQTFGVEVYPLLFDIRDGDAVEQALNSRPDSWKEVDILVNNAGLAKGLAPIHEGNLDHWETMIDTNVKGLLYISRLISQGMVARKKGHIINISSTAGKEAYPNGNVYCATKFAVEALTRSMRFDLYQHGIRVSQVSPGHVEETEFALVRFDGDAERAQIYQDFQPLKASDVAEAIWFIASRPAHVNIQDVFMMSNQQASATHIDRSGRA